MGKIAKLKPITHSKLIGVRVYSLSNGGAPERGVPQEVFVEVDPHAVIPLHSHTVDAEMYIVGGSGEVLASDETINGAQVQAGSLVFFEKQADHGFRAGADGLRFISRNGGIVTPNESGWDIAFGPEGTRVRSA